MYALSTMSDRVDVRSRVQPGCELVLSPGALRFLGDLASRFGEPILDLLALRRVRQGRFDRGELPAFLAETRDVREADWTIAPVPADLDDRRVEITGPTDRKMVINALNSGANVFMADFEDANTPTWDNLLQGQVNLMDAVRRTITFAAPETRKRYELASRPATLVVRPRGLHLAEKHLFFDGRPIAGALFDFGLYVFHNADALLRSGTGPYFYLPKLESHLEARLWNDVFLYAEDALGLRPGTIKATVLIETLPAAFEMDEILFELKDHSAGLNCGRWDYIFSFIKKRRHDPLALLPDRAEVTMDKGFLRAYTELLVKTCHRRGAHAMGGMAAQIPIKDDPEGNEAAIAKVRADKLREVRAGHDGTWVAHPALVPVAKAVFDEHMQGKNQIDRKREDVDVSAADLLAVADGPKTEAGLCHNIRVGILYLESWLRGVGCAPLFHLMEDAATAEIARAQVWQWIRHGARLDSGETVTRKQVRSLIRQEAAMMIWTASERGVRPGFLGEASALFEQLCCDEEFADFLTLPAYEKLLARGE
jgi:malate synthase